MTETLNFTAKEILPSLLDKTKTQTIRPAFKQVDYCNASGGEFRECKVDSFEVCDKCKWSYEEKPSRFKVGEQVTLYWNQRSETNAILGTAEITEVFKIEIKKHKIFDDSDDGVWYEISFDMGWLKTKIKNIAHQNGKDIAVYSNVENGCKVIDCFNGADRFYKDIAKRDGFKSADKMFKWFDKKYDLSSPQEFWVYRWRWL